MNARTYLISGLLGLPAMAALLLAMSQALAVAGGMGTTASFENAGEARSAYARAQRAATDAAQRAERLERQAQEASASADQTTREAAALAARVQQAEANIIAAQARHALLTDQRRVLDARMAEQQQPLVRLTAALQNMARRPLVLSALQPGSLKDTVYVRAVLETTMPQIRGQTAALRDELAQGRALEREAGEALAQMQANEGALQERRRALEAMATRQRLAYREARQVAQRESQRALELTEDARDLDGLIGELERAGGLRDELAALPGPLVRPPRPGASQVMETTGRQPLPRPTGLPAPLQLPVQGRTLAGFGESDEAGLTSKGLQLEPTAGAQVIAPAPGRVAFAGPYRGFGDIVIIEHGNGFTSLVTGLARTDVAAGDQVIGGSPIGAAPVRQPTIGLEVRRDGKPVNPLELM